MATGKQIFDRVFGSRKLDASHLDYLLEPLEPRLLLSADPLSAAVGAAVFDQFQANYQSLDEGALERSLADVTENARTPGSPAVYPYAGALDLSNVASVLADGADSTLQQRESLVAEQEASRQELIFIDGSVENYQSLLQGILQEDTDTNYRVVVLQSDTNGLQQISNALQGYSGIDAIHLVSHGGSGGIQLGDSWLTADTLTAYQAELELLRDALDTDADLLIYGCNLAGSASGLQLLQGLGQFTGADVAASDDITGSAALGGDWDLEYNAGSIETSVAFTLAAQQQWQGALDVTFTVDTTADTADALLGDGLAQDASGNTSLRAAIEEANAWAGDDTIILDAGTYTLSMGDLTIGISSNITLIGADAATTIIDGGGLDRIFFLDEFSTLTASELTLQGGLVSGSGAPGDGGAIYLYDDSTLNLERVIISGNQATDGGAIFSKSAVNLTDVTISGNTATDGGTGMGGALNNIGDAILTNVTISGNNADIAGGIRQANSAGDLDLTNVTISGNMATVGAGGGLHLANSANLINVTISNNSAATNGGGIFVNNSGSADLSNTIVANNSAGGSGNDISGEVTSVATNIIEDAVGASITGSYTSGDPNLGGLASNGGFTQTHALLLGSNAIDNGTALGAPDADQRGYARIAATDIGAYEYASFGLIWVDQAAGKIQVANLDGSGVMDLITGLSSPESVAIDTVGGKVYWSDSVTNSIHRANLDGTASTPIIAGLPAGTVAIELNLAIGKIYWGEAGAGTIKRADLNGTNIESLVGSANVPTGIALDIENDKVYWVDVGQDRIKQTSLTGAGTSNLVGSGIGDAGDVALDLVANQLYWTDKTAGEIWRVDFDGSDITMVLGGLGPIYGVAIDSAAGKIYWTNDSTDQVQRANLDGSGVQAIASGIVTPQDIDVVYTPSAVTSYVVTNTNAGGAGSLEQAITNANTTAGLNNITFNIPGGGPHVITVDADGLPLITDAVFIDGWSEPDYLDDGAPVIRIDAGGVAADGLYLDVGSDGSTVRGLSITGFSGNPYQAIDIRSDGNLVVGNYLGLETDGTTVNANRVEIHIRGAEDNQIGGTGSFQRNVLAGGGTRGISIRDVGATDNIVINNDIGLDATGTVVGSGVHGIILWNGADSNRIGGTGTDEGNRIAGFNRGVTVDSNATAVTNTSILGNLIWANASYGIDLENDGVTPNDAGDVDGGANDRLNFPELGSVVQNGPDIDVDFELDVPAGTYRVELFENPGGISPSYYGEGQIFLGAVSVVSTGTGVQSFSETVFGVTASNLAGIAATATHDLGSGDFGPTSEFSGAYSAHYLDLFDTSGSYAGDDGTLSWSNNWQEVGEADGPDFGNVSVWNNLGEQGLQLWFANGIGAWREADLSGATSATLSFDWAMFQTELGDSVSLQISTDGVVWDTLATFDGPLNHAVMQSASYNIGGYIDNDTRIKFETVSGFGANDKFFVDNFRIDLVTGPSNNAPTLTTLSSPVDSTTEDTEVEVSFADLQAAGNEADVDGTVDAFVVKSVTSGTLTIGTSAGTATAWAAGSNDTIDATNQAYWTPTLAATGTLNAFTVVAKDDGGLESTPAVTAQINVAEVVYEPFVYGAGSLEGLNGGTGWATAWTTNSGTSALVNSTGLTSPTGTLPVQGGTAELNTSALYSQSRDLITTLGTDGTTVWLSFLLKADIAFGEGISLELGDGGANDTVTIGTTDDDFIISRNRVTTGASYINNVVTDAQTYLLVVKLEFAAGNDTVTLYLDPTPGLAGPDSGTTAQLTIADLGSFTEVGMLGGFSGNTSSLDEIRIGYSFGAVAPAGNIAPTLTTLSSPVDSTTEDTEVEVSFADLQAAGNEADVDGTVDAFVVQGVTTGTLTIGASAGTATAWAAGSNDTIDASNNAYWTPDGDANGTLNAFTVVARDNLTAESAAAVTAQISVAASNDAPTVSVPGTTFINEIHYDNIGVDSGEFVEIAGVAGNELDGWSLVMYSGFDGSVYDTVSLSGTIPNEADNFGTLAFTFAVNGIQNATSGNPDGLALVDSEGNVVQFLSYEGTFLATEGVANGMLSTDIGVFEDNTTTADGDSLQLNGPGPAFTWTAPAEDTPGLINTSQNFSALAAAINQTIDEDASLVFSSGNGNAITVADVDAAESLATDPVSVTLNVSNGALTLGSITGLGTVSGNTTASVTFTGTVAELNAALEGLTYQPTMDYNGSDTLTVLVDDQGNFGAGGNLMANGAIHITVDALNDDPSNIGTFPVADPNLLESGTIAVDFSAIELQDVDAGTNDIRVVLTTSNGGVLSASNGGGVTVTGSGTTSLTLTGELDDLNSFLDDATEISFTGAAGVSGNDADSIAVIVNDDGNVGSGGGGNVALGTLDVDITPRVITVTTSVDENDGDTTDILTLLATPGGTGISLREAIVATNNTLIAATPDQIILPSGDYVLGAGELDIDDDVVITGGGARTTTVDAELGSRVFYISDNTATITDLTITGGNGHGGGALVAAGATLNLTDVTMTGNTGDDGAAVHVHGTLNLDSVTLWGNTATKDGGALNFHGAEGGSLINVTISGNTAANQGGGLWTDAPITVTNSTIAFNTAPSGGGVFDSGGGNVTLKNSILHNPGSDNSNTALISGGANIDSDGTAGLGDLLDGVDPLLNSLFDYGGSTDTHSLQTASQAIDATGVTGAPPNDQRGFARDGSADIGAFEKLSASPMLDLDANNSGASGNDFAFTFIEGDVATAIADIDTTLVDVDSTTFDSVTLTISGLLDGDAETFTLDGSTFALATVEPGRNTTGLKYRVVTTNGAGNAKITITKQGGGTFSNAETVTLIKAIRYQHTDTDDPSDGDRLINVTVNDGISNSAAAITTINVDPVNDAPTLTVLGSPVDSTAEDTEVEVSFADLQAAGNEADVDGTVDAFVVKSVTTGTLRIGTSAGTATAWAASSNDTIDASNNAYWTPATGATGTLNAFAVVAKDDGGLESTPNVLAQINVAAGNIAPTLTVLSSPVDSTAEDTEVEVSFADLQTAGNEADVDGTVDAFVVKSVTTGTLRIGTSAGTATAWAASSNDTIDASNNAYWTPATGATGTLNAFAVVARDDGGLESTPNVLAQINVSAGNMAPTLTLLSGPVDNTNVDTEVEVSFADLQAAGNEADVDGTVDAFVVKSVTTGTLRIGTSAGTATAWAASSNDTIDASNNAYWTPATAATGTLNAFSVVAKDDGGLESIAAVLAQVNVTAGNTAPTLTLLSGPVDSTAEDTAVEISFGELLAVGNEADIDGTVDAFVVKSISSGTLHIGASAGTATAWAAGSNDTIDAGNNAYWTPAAEASGTLNAFAIVAKDDGGLESSPAVIAQVSVSAINDFPTLTLLTGPVESTDEDTEVEVSFAELLAAGNEADIDGTVDAFVIRSVTSGTLKIGATAATATAWAAGSNDTVNTSNNAYWTPALEATGDLNAFAIVARDNGGLDSSPAVVAQISVAAVNDPPTLTLLTSPVDTTVEDTGVEVSFAQLLAGGNAADTDGTVDAFVVKSVTGGSLRIGASAATATAWVADSNDSIDATGNAYWTPDDDANGTLNAFAVVARDDGGLESTPAVSVRIDVAPRNDAPVGSVLIDNMDPVAGDTLTASNTLSDVDGISGAINYQWQRNGVDIAGATGTSYNTIAEDTGNTIRVVASYLDDGESSELVESTGVTPLEPPVDVILTVEDLGLLDPGNTANPVPVTSPVAVVDDPETESGTGDSETVEAELPVSGSDTVNLDTVLNTPLPGGETSSPRAGNVFILDDEQLSQLGTVFGDSSDLSSLLITTINDRDRVITTLAQKLQMDSVDTSIDTIVDPLVFLGTRGFSDGLDSMRNAMNEDIRTNQTVLAGSVTLTAGFSVGYVVWLVRSGALFGAAMSALPAWRFMDPLPILAYGGKAEIEAEDEETLESIVEDKSDAEVAPTEEEPDDEREQPQ